MTTLDSLYQALNALDPAGVLASKAYDLTKNESLGLSGDAKDFNVGIPYNPWSNQDKTFESTLGIAFKDVLKTGISASTIKNGDKVFIDIAQLGGGWLGFFDSKGDGAETNLAHQVGKLLEDIPAEATPIIRFLIGSDGTDDAEVRWNGLKDEFHKLFWPGGKGVFKHKKAKVCIGYYSPNFDAKRDPVGVKAEDGNLKTLVKIVRTMVENVAKLVTDNPFVPETEKTKVKKALARFSDDELIKGLNAQVLPSISWNHAKLLVVNGRTLMTGGGNYWNEYADNQSQISDLQCKVKGNVALSAHAYCDYFWQYLNREHKTDARSFRRTADLTKGGISELPPWDANSEVDLVKPETRTKAGGDKSVLSVAKLGDWTGQMDQLRYPIQAIDAIRDVVLNVMFRYLWTQRGGNLISTFKLMVMPAVADWNLLKAFKDAGVSPATWSSRIARCKAIEEAKKYVYIDAEIIACDLHQKNKAWKDILEGYDDDTGHHQGLNEQVDLLGDKAWDGVIWPYDLIAAIAQFLKNVQVSGDIKTKDDAPGLRILLTTQLPGDHSGWEDQTRADELKQRIRWFASRPTGETHADYTKWFDARCVIKRISGDGSMFNHNKVYCVDKKLLYIGSDNPYPNYNEEHGIWIDDAKAITGWYDANFSLRWTSERTKVADMSPGDRSTMKEFPGSLFG